MLDYDLAGRLVLKGAVLYELDYVSYPAVFYGVFQDVGCQGSHHFEELLLMLDYHCLEKLHRVLLHQF